MSNLVELNEWEKGVCRSLQAFRPGLTLQTLEEQRVLKSVIRVAQYMAQRKWGVRNITRWSACSTVRINLRDADKPPERLDQQELFECVSAFVEEKKGDAYTSGILLLADIQPILAQDPQAIRLLREATEEIKSRQMKKTIMILGRTFDLPEELRSEYPVIEFEIPSTEDLYKVFKKFLDQISEYDQYKGIVPSEQTLRDFSQACTGLTEAEGRSVLSLSIAKFEKIDDRAVHLAQTEKARSILRGEALSMVDPKCGLEGVGGLEGLKAWVDKVTPIVKDPVAALKYGLRIPSGLLLVGIPGCGKSLMCEALAKHWSIPLLVFNVGAAYGSLVGESEGNVRQMQSMANALKPCIVMTDEIEKGLGGDSADGGTSNRVKQSLLTWLNDKSDEIFVVATANDLDKLRQTPELIRAGRFDQTFFCDLPDARSRMEIFGIHLKRTGHTMSVDEITELAKLTKGYSGAEIEAIVQTALREAYAATPRPENPTMEMFKQAIDKTKPLGKVMEGQIEKLRDFCKAGRAEPAGATIEDDTAKILAAEEDEASLQAAGLPVLFDSLGMKD